MTDRHFATDEAKLFRDIRATTRRVENQLIPDGPSKEVIYWLAPQFPEQVPQCEIDATDRVYDQPFSTVINSREIHLVPDPFDVRSVYTFEESR